MKRTRWKTEDSLQKEIDDFFKMCHSEEKIATRISLASYLGLTKDDFKKLCDGGFDTSRAKLSNVMRLTDVKIEEYMENLLFTKEKGHSAILFYLKSNFGWSDKCEEVKEGEKIEVNISVIEEGEG